MPHDVVDLHGFYRTRLGQWTRRAIREELYRLWPDTRAMRILGVGYATPYLRPFLKPSERVLAFMPARQGAVHWPAEGPNRVSLVEEAEFPLSDSSVDRVLMVHSVEHADELRRLLREIWRVLSPNGRVIVIVPNRHSLWSWSETTPFGHGRPFTGAQLNRLLRENMFLSRPGRSDVAGGGKAALRRDRNPGTPQPAGASPHRKPGGADTSLCVQTPRRLTSHGLGRSVALAILQ